MLPVGRWSSRALYFSSCGFQPSGMTICDCPNSGPPRLGVSQLDHASISPRNGLVTNQVTVAAKAATRIKTKHAEIELFMRFLQKSSQVPMRRLYQNIAILSIALIMLFLGVFSSVNAQFSPLLLRQQAPSAQTPKIYTKEELKRKLAREIILIEGDGKGDGKYETEDPRTKKRERVTTSLTDLTIGIANARESSFGKKLVVYLNNLLIQVKEELRLLKDLYKTIDNLSEKEIDSRLDAISRQMILIAQSMDIAIKELDGLKSTASINPFSDKADELQANINQMMAKRVYLQRRSAELNLIIKGKISQPLPPVKPIKDQIKEQEELFKQLLKQAKQQINGGALVLNLFDEPGFWEKWFGGGQKNKPEDEQTLAKLKLINDHLRELVKNEALTEEDIKKLEDAKTLEEKIKIIVDIQERENKPPEDIKPPARPAEPALKTSIEELEKMFRDGWPGEFGYNIRKAAIEKEYKNDPEKLKKAIQKMHELLINIMPYNIRDRYLKKYKELYGEATKLPPQTESLQPEPPKQKLKITYYINPNDESKYKSKLDELSKNGEIEFRMFKNVNVPPGEAFWYIKGYSPEQVKDWVEGNIIKK